MQYKQDTIDYSDEGKSVSIISNAYVFKHKLQKSKYTKIPTGTIGYIKLRTVSSTYNIEYYLVRFYINGELFYGKLARSMLEFL